MRVIYFDCNMGAAGDMLLGALLELYGDVQSFAEKLNSIGLPGAKYYIKESIRGGIAGTHVDVLVNGECEGNEVHHSHHGHGMKMGDIIPHLKNLHVSDRVKRDAEAIYKMIAGAESIVHKKKVDEIHFHELGMMDAIADIVGVCMLIEQLDVDKILASPVNTGKGQVRCAHGIMPVPAPATAYLLQGIPVFSNSIEGELCTPTGAAILKYFVQSFGTMPTMTMQAIGYGMGSRNYEAPNCVRAIMAEQKEESSSIESVVELCCNIDDMTGEAIGFALQILFDNGALDVCIVPMQTKKNRPGIQLVCLCSPDKTDELVGLLFKHTSTFGIRKKTCERFVLDRHFTEAQTIYGKIKMKHGKGFGIEKSKYEYEDLARAAKENNLSLDEVEGQLMI